MKLLSSFHWFPALHLSNFVFKQCLCPSLELTSVTAQLECFLNSFSCLFKNPTPLVLYQAQAVLHSTHAPVNGNWYKERMPWKLQLKNKSSGRLEANKNVMIKQMLKTGWAVTNAPAVQSKAWLFMLLKWQGACSEKKAQYWHGEMSLGCPVKCSTLCSAFYRHNFYNSLFLLVGPRKWAVKRSRRVH